MLYTKYTPKKRCDSWFFLLLLGLFNAANKVLVGLDILLEWREYLKEGVPISNVIKRKLKALTLRVDEVSFK